MESCIARIEAGNFNLADVKSVYTDLRQYADESITKEIGHFINHPPSRNRGPFIDRTRRDFLDPLVEDFIRAQPATFTPTILYRQSQIIADLVIQLRRNAIEVKEPLFLSQGNNICHHVLDIIGDTELEYRSNESLLGARIDPIEEFNGCEAVFVAFTVLHPATPASNEKIITWKYPLIVSEIPFVST